jgi:hypothetical protein
MSSIGASNKYDIERFFNDLETVLKSNINTKITEINNEKNDDIFMKPVEDDAYIKHSLNQEVVNYDPYIFMYIDNIESSGIGPRVSKVVSVDIAMVIKDPLTETMSSLVLRYLRSLEEVLTEKFNTVNKTRKIEVKSLAPFPFQSLDSSHFYYAIGVRAETTIA